MRERPRLVDSGPFAYARHPIYTQVSNSPSSKPPSSTILTHRGTLIVCTSLALAFWSYIPLYTLPLAIGGYLLKVPIEVRDPSTIHFEVSKFETVNSPTHKRFRTERSLRTLSRVCGCMRWSVSTVGEARYTTLPRPLTQDPGVPAPAHLEKSDRCPGMHLETSGEEKERSPVSSGAVTSGSDNESVPEAERSW